MKRSPALITTVTVAWVMSSVLFGQGPVEKRQPKAEEIVRLWFERWNALDGSEEATSRLLE